MPVTVYVPRDSAALAVGADAVAAAIAAGAQAAGVDLQLVRNGSRGLFWLEPLVEVATETGRVAYGPVTPEDVPALFAAGFLQGGTHPLCQGPTDAIPFLQRQERLTFARMGLTDPLSLADYQAHAGFDGLRRAKISGRLQHAHIVTVFDVGEDQGVLYLAMEVVQGGSFSQRLANPAGFSIRDRVRVVAEVAEALAHAHERGVLHRDIKPANILLSPSLSAKVTDFGIGKLLTGDTELTSTGQMVGSPAYMSPEQVQEIQLDHRTDIYSLSIVLFQLLTGRLPFQAATQINMVYQILHDNPPPPSSIRPELPAVLDP